jgi:nucleoid DNA-binding protein
MIRSELANKLATKMNISKQEADRTLLAFINSIMTNLEKDSLSLFRDLVHSARRSMKPMSAKSR